MSAAASDVEPVEHVVLLRHYDGRTGVETEIGTAHVTAATFVPGRVEFTTELNDEGRRLLNLPAGQLTFLGDALTADFRVEGSAG